MTAAPVQLQPWQIVDLPLHKLITLGRKAERSPTHREVRYAILGDAATQHYRQALDAVLKLRGWWPETYEAEFDTIRQEVLDPASGLNAAKPEFVVLLMASQALWSRHVASSEKARFADEIVNEITSIWTRLRSSLDATIIQHNFVVPPERPYGNATSAQSDSFSAAVSRINARLSLLAGEHHVRLVDTEYEAALHGKRHWLDERLWAQARQALSPAFLPSLAKNVSDIILFERGVGVKCVIVDLDNTMWGGILAEDGPDLIEIGQTELGLVFQRVQLALLELKNRGVLLAICSKNDEHLVREVIDTHPDMVLRLSDFAACVANFGDKVNNIIAIKEKLNLGWDSFVFLDDTPFERALVRDALPQIQVPELPQDPAGYLAELARLNLFEGRAPTAEDAARLGYYQSDAKRDEIRARFEGLEDFVADLAMKAEVRPFDSFTMPRVLQLVQRSNQFNLTTIRYSEDQLLGLAEEKGAVTFSIRLADRLGDNGIIATVIVRREGEAAVVDTWIMSCRVLGRKVEELTCNLIVETARTLGCDRIVGRYIPTAKNAMVAELYQRLGFQPAGRDGLAETFTLDVAAFTPRRVAIEIRQFESAE